MESESAPPLVSIRTMNIVVAAVLMIVGGIVIIDSIRLGTGWTESQGPAGGYFPFYIGLLLVLASAINLARAVFAERAIGSEIFVTRPAFRRVLAVFLPLLGYVLVLTYIGIYIASAIYIALFMWYFGEYRLSRGVLVGAAVAFALFLMFEVWFLVPLPKGPVEALLGY
jgi:putative tricarboxylic transport membrane protein